MSLIPKPVGETNMKYPVSVRLTILCSERDIREDLIAWLDERSTEDPIDGACVVAVVDEDNKDSFEIADIGWECFKDSGFTFFGDFESFKDVSRFAAISSGDVQYVQVSGCGCSYESSSYATWWLNLHHRHSDLVDYKDPNPKRIPKMEIRSVKFDKYWQDTGGPLFKKRKELLICGYGRPCGMIGDLFGLIDKYYCDFTFEHSDGFDPYVVYPVIAYSDKFDKDLDKYLKKELRKRMFGLICRSQANRKHEKKVGIYNKYNKSRRNNK